MNDVETFKDGRKPMKLGERGLFVVIVLGGVHRQTCNVAKGRNPRVGIHTSGVERVRANKKTVNIGGGRVERVRKDPCPRLNGRFCAKIDVGENVRSGT